MHSLDDFGLKLVDSKCRRSCPCARIVGQFGAINHVVEQGSYFISRLTREAWSCGRPDLGAVQANYEKTVGALLSRTGVALNSSKRFAHHCIIFLR